jgi:hypothetical protein
MVEHMPMRVPVRLLDITDRDKLKLNFKIHPASVNLNEAKMFCRIYTNDTVMLTV